jgi:hypothetical protein
MLASTAFGAEKTFLPFGSGFALHNRKNLRFGKKAETLGLAPG